MARATTIPNWSQLGVKVVGVSIYRHDDDDTPTYQAAFTLFLDDGEVYEDDNLDKQPVITIYTDNVSDDADKLAVQTADIASKIWHEVASDVPVIDEDGMVFRRIDLNTLVTDENSVSIH
jgi:hypothetical protein